MIVSDISKYMIFAMMFVSDLLFTLVLTHINDVMSLSIYIANKEVFKNLLLIQFTPCQIISPSWSVLLLDIHDIAIFAVSESLTPCFCCEKQWEWQYCHQQPDAGVISCADIINFSFNINHYKNVITTVWFMDLEEVRPHSLH